MFDTPTQVQEHLTSNETIYRTMARELRRKVRAATFLGHPAEADGFTAELAALEAKHKGVQRHLRALLAVLEDQDTSATAASVNS